MDTSPIRTEVNSDSNHAQMTKTNVLPKGVLKSILLMILAVIISVSLYSWLPYESNVSKGVALLAFIGTLWLTEAIHITVTALLVPIVAVLIGIEVDSANGLKALSTKDALITFADPIIFLLFGGFVLATALHIQQLDKKIAMKLISLSKGHLGYAVFSIFGATAFLSMWISNTATAAMMLPLALGILTHLDPQKDRKTFVFILLGIAYSASIGGLGTLVGSPPNAIVAAALGYDFADWMKVGFPFMLILLPAMLFSLYLVLKPNLNQRIKFVDEDIPWTKNRILTIVIFISTALAWIFSKDVSQFLNISQSDTWISITAATLVMILGVASWKQVSEHTEWGVLMLFGGGLALSGILQDSGASLALGNTIAETFSSASAFTIIFVVTIFIIILTEFTSNTASAALLVPIFAVISTQIGLPKEALVIVIGVGASCAFMLPVATPPNAIVFSAGYIKQSEMMQVGMLLNILCIFIISIFCYVLFT